ncbi:YggS family pyridoxal phosphate-dependent enzyme [Candidatus Aeolococcus gillhamiae]|uniref:YggS family pyridoxal phosphate-dependent enzyme n=1 Tax=Candidatus Aeolococcus gillhamiae TaxID=3127015 RepID=UPI00307784DB
MSEPSAAEVAERLEKVRDRVRRAAAAAGRDPAGIRLLAVTKGHSVDAVATAASLGLRDIGESRVQEAQGKRSAFAGGDVTWHMIGHLQRNKARAAATLFDVVHSVDGIALAAALARHRTGAPTPLRVFVEVELTGIAGRTGATPDETPALLDELCALAELEVAGLMTIAPPGAPELADDCFARLRDLRDALRDRQGMTLDGLSMGMSDDFEIAIAHGATVIRLGRVLFGNGLVAGR